MTKRQATLAELAAKVGATLHGDGELLVDHVAPLERAGAGAVSFFTNPRYRRQLQRTQATVVVLAEDALADCPVAALVCSNPYYVYATIAHLLNPPPAREPGIHPSAYVHPTAVLGADVSIGAHAVIEAGARVGDRVSIGPGCVIGPGASVGDDSWLAAKVVLARDVVVGRRAVIHSGAVLGADGFGFARGPEGWLKVPQLGGVRVGDDVEIGANTTIDRGALDDTIIGDGVKIDNLVQIGHNVRVGRNSLICGAAGVAGSATIGENCVIGGACVIAGHIELADGVTVMGGTGVSGSLTEPGAYCSVTPVAPARQWRRNAARFNHLDDMFRRLKALENELARLKAGVAEEQRE